MTPFTFYLRDRLEENGYLTLKHDNYNDLFMREQSSIAKPVWICYLDKPIEPEQIRRFLEFPGYLLFVVNEKLIPDEIVSRKETPMWLRVLHGLYMGRIYVWNGRYLFGLHFDYDTGDVSESGIIQPDELLLVETGTWLRGWPGLYRIARFYDKQWWGSVNVNWEPNGDQAHTKSAGDSGYESPGYTQWKTDQKTGWAYTDPGASQSNARAEYEQTRDSYWGQQRAREQQYQQERERAQRQQYDSDGFAYDPNDWPGGKPPKPPPKSAPPDFMTQFARAGSKNAIKTLYKQLAKQFHPDMNPGVDTTEIMQSLNAAYDRYR